MVRIRRVKIIGSGSHLPDKHYRTVRCLRGVGMCAEDNARRDTRLVIGSTSYVCVSNLRPG